MGVGFIYLIKTFYFVETQTPYTSASRESLSPAVEVEQGAQPHRVRLLEPESQKKAVLGTGLNVLPKDNTSTDRKEKG